MTKPELGVENGHLLSCPKTPNCVNSQSGDKSHYIEPLLVDGTAKHAQESLLDVLEHERRANIVTVREDYIRAEFRSALFRFVDDVEFYFPGSQTGKTTIHVRSASRLGYSDFGVNRVRIERIRRRLGEIKLGRDHQAGPTG